MKKESVVLLVLCACCLCAMIGIFWGRNLMPVEHNTLYDDTIPTPSVESVYENGKVNINKAGITELMQLPGIGEGIAKRILEYRREKGSFSSIDDLLEVEGIGPGRFEDLKELITVGG